MRTRVIVERQRNNYPEHLPYWRLVQPQYGNIVTIVVHLQYGWPLSRFLCNQGTWTRGYPVQHRSHHYL